MSAVKENKNLRFSNRLSVASSVLAAITLPITALLSMIRSLSSEKVGMVAVVLLGASAVCGILVLILETYLVATGNKAPKGALAFCIPIGLVIVLVLVYRCFGDSILSGILPGRG